MASPRRSIACLLSEAFRCPRLAPRCGCAFARTWTVEKKTRALASSLPERATAASWRPTASLRTPGLAQPPLHRHRNDGRRPPFFSPHRPFGAPGRNPGDRAARPPRFRCSPSVPSRASVSAVAAAAYCHRRERPRTMQARRKTRERLRPPHPRCLSFPSPSSRASPPTDSASASCRACRARARPQRLGHQRQRRGPSPSAALLPISTRVPSPLQVRVKYLRSRSRAGAPPGASRL